MKETLDLEWGHTIATVILGWIAQAVTMVIAGIMLAVIGFGAVVFGGTFRSLVWQE